MELDPKDYQNLEVPPELTMKVKEKKGCFFYGCLTAVILFLVCIVGVYIAINKAFKVAQEYADQYTETAPLRLESTSLTYEEFQSVRDRLVLFFEGLKAGTLREDQKTLKLTEVEINTLISRESQLSPIKDKLRVRLENGQLKGKLSIPLGQFSFGGLDLKGKYFNGTGTFSIKKDGDRLIVNSKKLTVGGQELPDQIMEELRKKNLAEDANEKVEHRELIKRLSRIEIEGNNLIVEAK